MSGSPRLWFYLVDGARVGPIPDAGLRGQLRDGTLSSDSPVWTEGMADWEPAAVALPKYALASGMDEVQPLPSHSPIYYPVSTAKFIVMSVLTWGLYDLYWAYRNWKYVKDASGLKISPFWRAWFTVFFNYELLGRIKEETSARTYATWSPGWLTAAYLLLLLSSRLPDPLWLVSVFSFVPLLPVIRTINDANSAAFQAESRFSTWDIAGAAAGVLWSLLILSAYVWPS
ncbi:MAG: DUF4339 domain-containing protein [Coriobacteriia bacterium]